jgi:predicted kinase
MRARAPVTLYLMCGLAFSGKSTLAGAIAARAGATIVSLDAINAARGLRGGLGIPEEEWAWTHRQALELTRSALARGRSVVVDDTNCFRSLRDDYRAAAAAHGATAVVVYLDVPLPVVRSRMRANEKAPSRHPVSETVLLDLAGKFEPPAPDEPMLFCPPDREETSWVNENIPAPEP